MSGRRIIDLMAGRSCRLYNRRHPKIKDQRSNEDRRRPIDEDCIVYHCPVCVKYLSENEVSKYGDCSQCGIEADYFTWAELVALGREKENRSGEDKRSD